MRRHASVFLLAVRGITGKLILLLLALGAVEWALLARVPVEQELEAVLEASHIDLAFRAALLALTVLCCLFGSGLRGGRTGYTLGRLSVGESAVLFWWSLCYAAAFLILMGFQLLILLVYSRFYLLRADPSLAGPQTVFLAAYQNSLFHSLLPLEEWQVYVRNLVFALSLGVTSAAWSYWRRREKGDAAVYGVAGLAAVFFPSATGTWSGGVLWCVIAASLSAYTLSNVWREVHSEKTD